MTPQYATPAEVLPEDECPQPCIENVDSYLTQIASANRLPKELRTRNVRSQFQFAFDLIGGVPALAWWAKQHPGAFYALYSKLIPAQISGENGGPLKVELSWLNGRDLTGRSTPPITIDVQPEPSSAS